MRSHHPACPNCGLDNWSYGQYKLESGPEIHFGYYWDGPGRALFAGKLAKLYTKRGRIYGGGKSKRWGEGAPCRVNERKWKVVRSGIRLLVACAHPFHKDESK